MTAEAEVQELIERRAAATRAKDMDAALEPFASDVTTFDVINPLRHHGTNSRCRTRMHPAANAATRRLLPDRPG